MRTRFYAVDAAERSGLPLYVVDRYDRVGILRPSIRRASGSGRHRPRVYSMDDVVALSVAARLRTFGMPARRIAPVLKALRGHVMARPRYLLTDGKSVFLRDEDGAVLDLLRRQQVAFAVFLDPLYDELSAVAPQKRGRTSSSASAGS